MQWFDVSKKGLAKLLEERGFAFIVYELIQNALDTDSPSAVVNISWTKGLASVEGVDEHEPVARGPRSAPGIDDLAEPAGDAAGAASERPGERALAHAAGVHVNSVKYWERADSFCAGWAVARLLAVLADHGVSVETVRSDDGRKIAVVRAG